MDGIPERVALVSLHTSPAEQAGVGDAGGMNVAIRSLARELAARGVTVDLLTRAITQPRDWQLESGVTVYELAAGSPGPMRKNELAQVSDEFGEAVSALAAQRRYEIIHAHYWLSGIATLPVALALGVPFVQSFHTLGAMKNRLAPPGSVLEGEQRIRSEAYLATQANAIVVGSAAEATALIDEVRAPANSVWVVPPGVDIELFHPNRGDTGRQFRGELSIAHGAPILAVAGRIQPLKGQELAIRALAEIRVDTPPVLVIAGEATPGDDEYLAGLQLVASELGVADRVRFVGALERDDLAELFAVASLTLVPSHSETFGLVALESAASGTPVVGYRSTGLVESVVEGRTGVLVDSRDPADWAATITNLLADGTALHALSETARDHALGHTWAVSATALLSIYSSL